MNEITKSAREQNRVASDGQNTSESSARSLSAQTSQPRMAERAKENRRAIQGAALPKRGQPTKFTPALWEELLECLACGQNLVEVCARPDMPAFQTVRRWYRADETLKAQIEEAWLENAYFAHSINDNILRKGVMSTGDFRRDEAIVANNRWFMGKTSGRLFNDKLQVEQTITVKAPQMPSWFCGEVVDGQLVDDQDPTI